jgi:aryl-alcohol dehydrogenase-like predicted oxidoreductase
MDYLIYAAEQSLKRLKVDTLDILQLHSPVDENLAKDDPWEALYRLKKEGKIRFAGWSIQSFRENDQSLILDQYHELIDCVQVRYNLLERDPEKVLFVKTQNYGIGVIVRIPLLFGLLTGKFSRKSKFPDNDHRHLNLTPQKLDQYLSDLESSQSLFKRYPDQSMAQVSLRFAITHPATHVAIPGAKTVKQVEDNVAAADLGPIT